MSRRVGSSRRRAVFLDRDGVLNDAMVRNGLPYSPASVAELEYCPGVEQACADLKRAGFVLIMVTNQPNIARGIATIAKVDEINRIIQTRLELDDVRVCPHDDSDNCDCRKPKPGLLLTAARDLGIDLQSSFMVGDRWRDVAAGHAAGCRTVFISYGYAERQPENPDFVAVSLAAATPDIISASIIPKGKS
jgi:D-glycero-D-manno-heptose 1,7-bisphosphate phosphatase